MVKSNGKSGWQTHTHDPSKFKRDLESSTAMPETFEEHRTKDLGREKMCKSLRKFFIKENIQRYAVISSAWYTTHKKDEKPDCPPSQSPKKKECIFLYSEDRKGKFCFSGWDIITKNGLRELKEIHNSINKDIDPKDDAYKRGKFMGLLQHLDKEGEK